MAPHVFNDLLCEQIYSLVILIVYLMQTLHLQSCDFLSLAEHRQSSAHVCNENPATVSVPLVQPYRYRPALGFGIQPEPAPLPQRPLCDLTGATVGGETSQEVSHRGFGPDVLGAQKALPVPVQIL